MNSVDRGMVVFGLIFLYYLMYQMAKKIDDRLEEHDQRLDDLEKK